MLPCQQWHPDEVAAEAEIELLGQLRKIKSMVRHTAFIAIAAAVFVRLALGNAVVFGQSACIASSSWCSFLGLSVNTGLLASFTFHNRYTFPRPEFLITTSRMNDNMNPDTAASNTEALLDSFLLVNEVGTPTALAAMQTATANGIPFVAPVSGHTTLRFPFQRGVINLRPSMVDEITSVVDFLVNTRGLRTIGILQQADEYGENARTVLDTVLGGIGMSVAGSSKFDPFGEDMSTAFEALRSTTPEAVILVGVSAPVVKFIGLAIDSGWTPTLVLLSFDVDGVLDATLTYPGYLFFTSAVPSPWDDESTLARRYMSILTNYTATRTPRDYYRPSYLGLEGFLSARFLLAVLKELVALGFNFTDTGMPTRDNMLDTIYAKSIWQIDGETIGPFLLCPEGASPETNGCNQGLHTVYLFRVGVKGAVSFVKRFFHSGCGNDTAVSLPQDGHETYAVVIAACSAGGAAVVAAVLVTGFVCVWRKKKESAQHHSTALGPHKSASKKDRTKTTKTKKKKKDSQLRPLLPQQMDARRPYHMQATADVLATAHNIPCIKRDELCEFALVGTGSSAKVYRAKWHGTTVAVKQLHNPLELSLDTVVKELAEEIKLWSQLKHPHVVQFLGMTPDLWLVMEFMEHGSLKTLMKRHQTPIEMRIKLMHQVALAIDYLHSRKVIHRDLNPNNIMVTGLMKDLQAKVADFGLSRMEQALLQHTKSVGTPVYAAPEVLYGGVFTPKSDSYSFGLTLWFAETAEEPFEDVHSHFELIEAVIKNKRRPSLEHCHVLPELITQCMAEEAEQRPAFSAIAETLWAWLSTSTPALASALPSSSAPTST